MAKRVSIHQIAEFSDRQFYGKLTFQEAAFVIEYCKHFSSRTAAESVGLNPDTGYSWTQKEKIAKAIEYVLSRRLEASDITAEWVMMETVDNHLLARQVGKIGDSNNALKMLMQHKNVNAMAVKELKVDVNTSDEMVQRLQRARDRLQRDPVVIEGESEPVTEGLSFL